MSKGGKNPKRGKYSDWITEDGALRIESWASDGLTNEDIAHNIGIARSTLNVWRKKYPLIEDAIKKGREPVTRKLENAIIKKAMGFNYDETERYIEEVDGVRKERVKILTKYSVPDSTALIFLLKNYKPNKYRNYNDVTLKKVEAEIDKIVAETEKMKRDTEAMGIFEDKLGEYFEILGDIIDDEKE